ncbi:SidA/IucD/PvdA family monooxygenase [Pseudoalteromonas luteoviolacea]|uniref:L-ornithine 5-monooxygenase n=1 Tax=Pseudoalteromonas luteoviolacea NCIMB 1942 TaxID=1365253 RepID=A0A167CLW3_9GAMM|nr:SidA/IucD/PvdA family monooxygenase [Pseudoalteromonas luteoviolacea]KZN47818.1 hypothetical protein N482_08885 [Pseudoalteromonas luteoviolacea NCIMB 1942]
MMTKESIYDYIGIGFGPSNLAIAIAEEEQPCSVKSLFLEQKSKFSWHPGMMIDGSRLQISFLKDLVTLRNPKSKFSFLEYLRSKGRLEAFVNLAKFSPTRTEYQDYLSWVALHFDSKVAYDTYVKSVEMVKAKDQQGAQIDVFKVVAAHPEGERVYITKNVIHAPGGKANWVENSAEVKSHVIHSSEFLKEIDSKCPNKDGEYTFAVVGSGQSAAEICVYLLEHYPSCEVKLVSSKYALEPSEASPFVNECFNSDESEFFFKSSESTKKRLMCDLQRTNYSVVEIGLLEQLYDILYAQKVTGEHRFSIQRLTKLESIQLDGDKAVSSLRNVSNNLTSQYSSDLVVLATGYIRELDKVMFAGFEGKLSINAHGQPEVTKEHAAIFTDGFRGRLFLQGLTESSMGLSDTLLSLLPMRSEKIIKSIVGQTSANLSGIYPPRRHVSDDTELALFLIKSFPFATLVSNAQNGAPHVTQLPLIYSKDKLGNEVLFGHMDRGNPQIESLFKGDCKIVFHGPDTYISPRVYNSDQLPTWNSISVHITGLAEPVSTSQELVTGLQSISQHHDKYGYQLSKADPRIKKLSDFIIGFNIEIKDIAIRAKLSQDRDVMDQNLANDELYRSNTHKYGGLFNFIPNSAVSQKSA